jgi:hypothetical protein
MMFLEFSERLFCSTNFLNIRLANRVNMNNELIHSHAI